MMASIAETAHGRSLPIIQNMYTKQEFLQLLKSNRKVYAYVLLNPDCAIYVKQSKSTWIKRVQDMDDAVTYEIGLTRTTIHIS